MSKIADKKGLVPGTEIFNTRSGEVMTYVCNSFDFTMRGGRPGVVVYAYGYDDYKRIVEWPYDQSERV